MKKRILAALLAAAMMVSLCACGNGDGDSQGTGDKTPATPPSITSLAAFDDLDTILKDKDYEVTEEDVIDYFVSMLCAQGAGLIEIKDRDTVQKGDIVQVDYVGYLNDKAFDNGAADNQIVDVSKNCLFGEYTGEYGSTFIEKFTDGLIGAKKKETVKHNVTFPEKYSDKDLAGKETTFEFHVDRIYIKATPDNVTDDYVKKYMEKQGFTTVEGLLQDCREQLVAKAVLNYVISESKVEVSEAYLNERLETYEEGLVEASGAASIEEVVSNYYGSTLSAVRPYWLSYIKSRVITEVVFSEMVKSKNLTVDETKLQEYVDDVLAVNSSFEDADEIYFEFGYGDLEKGKECLGNQITISDYIIEKYNASQAVTE